MIMVKGFKDAKYWDTNGKMMEQVSYEKKNNKGVGDSEMEERRSMRLKEEEGGWRGRDHVLAVTKQPGLTSALKALSRGSHFS